MKAHPRFRHLLLPLLLAATAPAAAQTAAQNAAQNAPPPATDVIFRTDGAEIPGRVVAITPVYVQYVPAARADTVRLPAATVFMVRYANGTRDVLRPAAAAALAPIAAPYASYAPYAAPAPPPPDLLPGLSDAARTALGRADAGRYYRSSGPFLGSCAAGLGGGLLLGIIAPACIAPRPVAEYNLGAPRPALLADFAYGGAYRQEAHRLKRGRAWGGYGVGVGLLLALVLSNQ